MIWLHCDDSEAPRGHTLWHRSFQRCGPGYLFMLGCSTISLAARGRSIQMMCWFFPAVLLKFHMRSDAAPDPFAAAFASATAGQFNGAITPRSSATNMKIGHSSSTQPSAAFSSWSWRNQPEFQCTFYHFFYESRIFSFLGSLSKDEDGEQMRRRHGGQRAARECWWILSAIFAQSQLKLENVIQVRKQLADICN